MEYIHSLAADIRTDLVALLPGDDGFWEAITSRSFTILDPKQVPRPDAILRVLSHAAVSDVLSVCAQHHLKVCVRCGGHDWHAGWLRPHTILLDVGDLNEIVYNEQTSTLSLGPGASGSEVCKILAQRYNLFFPCGHCPTVTVGGFLLGGGFGIGFSRYQMASQLVTGVDVVLATGECVHVDKENAHEPLPSAVLTLLRGSFSCFPAVVTRFHFTNLPVQPQGVLSGCLVFSIDDWKEAIQLSLDISYRGDKDANTMELTLVIKDTPPDIGGAASGSSQCVIVSIVIWTDAEEDGQAIWEKYIASKQHSTLLPLQAPTVIAPENLPDTLGGAYPIDSLYQVQAHSGNEQVYEMSDDEICYFVEPIVDLWKSDHRPRSTSHSLFVPIHRRLESQSKGLAYGFVPSLTIMSYGVFQDASTTETYRAQLCHAHGRMRESSAFHTEMPEGDLSIDGPASAFSSQALQRARDCTRLLDPIGMFGLL